VLSELFFNLFFKGSKGVRRERKREREEEQERRRKEKTRTVLPRPAVAVISRGLPDTKRGNGPEAVE